MKAIKPKIKPTKNDKEDRKTIEIKLIFVNDGIQVEQRIGKDINTLEMYASISIINDALIKRIKGSELSNILNNIRNNKK